MTRKYWNLNRAYSACPKALFFSILLLHLCLPSETPLCGEIPGREACQTFNGRFRAWHCRSMWSFLALWRSGVPEDSWVRHSFLPSFFFRCFFRKVWASASSWTLKMHRRNSSASRYSTKFEKIIGNCRNRYKSSTENFVQYQRWILSKIGYRRYRIFCQPKRPLTDDRRFIPEEKFDGKSPSVEIIFLTLPLKIL